jgi:hypothetical protein
MGEIRNSYKIFIRKSEGKIHFRGPVTHGRVILQWIFKTGCETMEQIYATQIMVQRWAL